MEKSKENRKVRYTKKVLTESLMELLQSQPISAISIKELCARADINRSTFYAHYKDQYALLKEIEADALALLEEMKNRRCFQSGKDVVLGITEEALDLISTNVNWLQVLFTEQGEIQFQQKVFSFIQQEGMLQFKKDEMLDDVAKEYYITFALNGSIAVIQRWVKNGMNIPKEQLARMIIKLNRLE
ncbi:TetR family transcriptional regulator [Spirochaetia bacterium]|nr:TetR family transcriptional regulator [Spirochaetia bacterium]